MSADWVEDLLDGIGAYLDQLGIGTFMTDPAALVVDQDRPIVKGPIPEQPDIAIGMQPYSGSDDPVLADVVQPIQFWLRGTTDRSIVSGIGSAIFNTLHGATGLTLGGIPCPLIVRTSAPPMGRDSSGRYEAAHNYDFTAIRPTQYRTD